MHRSLVWPLVVVEFLAIGTIIAAVEVDSWWRFFYMLVAIWVVGVLGTMFLLVNLSAEDDELQYFRRMAVTVNYASVVQELATGAVDSLSEHDEYGAAVIGRKLIGARLEYVADHPDMDYDTDSFVLKVRQIFKEE